MKLLLIFFVVWSVSCSKSRNDSTLQGGQDSGGGNIVFSTEQDVSAAYAEAIQNLPIILFSLTENDFLDNVYDSEKRFLLLALKIKLQDLQENKSLHNRFNNYDMTKQNLPYGDELPDLLDLSIRLINNSEIKINRESHCSSMDKPEAYASTKEFKLGSPICLSFQKLKAVPKDSLYKEILGVLLHEYLHTLEFNEENIIILQSIMTENFYAITQLPIFINKDDLNISIYSVELPIHLYAVQKALRKNAGEKIAGDEKSKFCKKLNTILFTSEVLSKKYANLLSINKVMLINKKIMNESIAEDLESVFARMASQYKLKALLSSCANELEIIINHENKEALILLNSRTLAGIDAIEEIETYLFGLP